MNEADKARLKRLEEMVCEIRAFIVMARAPVLDDAQRDMAVKAFMEGKPELLNLFLERGGKPPDLEISH